MTGEADTSSSGGLVDVHAHFLTDTYIEAAVAAGHRNPDGMPWWPTWTVDDHLALMDSAGIDRSILSISSPGVHFGDDAAARALARETNEFAAVVVDHHPDRFGHFAALPLPDVPGAVAEARYCLDSLGADGVVILSNAGGLYPGDPAMDPLLTELDRRGAIVLAHPTGPPDAQRVARGRPLPMMEFLFDSARAAADLVLGDRLRRYPRIRWLLTHGGGVLPLLTARIDLFSLLDPAGPVDSAALLSRCWFDTAGTPLPTQLPALAGSVGTDHIVYGSDFCFTPAPAVVAQVAALTATPGPDPGGTWRELLIANTRPLLRP
jgi:predicted TIM-barrel fold metal-dependent hydrolase